MGPSTTWKPIKFYESRKHGNSVLLSLKYLTNTDVPNQLGMKDNFKFYLQSLKKKKFIDSYKVFRSYSLGFRVTRLSPTSSANIVS